MAYVINEDCIACGTCIDECPVDAISEGDIYVIDPEICTDCGSCAKYVLPKRYIQNKEICFSIRKIERSGYILTFFFGEIPQNSYLSVL